jgi:hypothetical protein
MSESAPDQPRAERTTEVPAVSDGATTLFVADFDDTDTAWSAYGALMSIENGRHVPRAAVLGRTGAAIGKARQLHRRSGLAERLEDAAAPRHSGILAIVSDPGPLEVRSALDRADAVVESSLDDVVAKDIRVLAKEVDEV